MTNIVIISISLLTNWAPNAYVFDPDTNGLSWHKIIREGTVFESVHLGYRSGTNAVEIGALPPRRLGGILQTNSVPGPIVPDK